MLYYLFKYLETLNIPGAGMFEYISFRSAAAVITSLIISLLIGKKVINYLQLKQVGEVVRDLDLEGQYRKQGTPSMGGLIIISSIVIPTLLFARLDNIYIILMLITTVWLGFIGFVDDYIKIFRKNKAGLAGKFKIMGQLVLGLVVGVTLYLSDDVVVRNTTLVGPEDRVMTNQSIEIPDQAGGDLYITEDVKCTKTTIPFVKNNEFDYSWLALFTGREHRQSWGWVIFVFNVQTL